MSVGSLSYGSTSIVIIAAQTPVGFIDDQAVAEEELLVAPGVNGRRWRTLFDQFPSFEMTTFSEASDYAAAITIKRKAENFKSKLAKLQVAIGSQTYAYRDVHISSARAICHPGPIFGADTGVNLAHIEIIWQLEMTAFQLGSWYGCLAPGCESAVASVPLAHAGELGRDYGQRSWVED